MQKLICFVFLAFMSLLQMSAAASQIAMPKFEQVYMGTNVPKFYSATRPKVEKNKADQTSVEDDMKSVEKGHGRMPISNPEDKVIEFIVTDIGR